MVPAVREGSLPTSAFAGISRARDQMIEPVAACSMAAKRLRGLGLGSGRRIFRTAIRNVA